jgi:hypothetical protein
MPKSYRIDWFLTPSFPRPIRTLWSWTETRGIRYEPDVVGWFDRLSASYPNQPIDSDDRKDLEAICKLVLNAARKWKKGDSEGVPPRPNEPPFSSADIARVLVACVDLDKKDLFLEAFELLPYGVPASTFKAFGTALLRYGLKTLLPK